MNLVPDGNSGLARKCAVDAVCTQRPFSTERDKILAVSEHMILTPTFPICLIGNGAAYFAFLPGGLNPRYTTGWEHLKFLHKLIGVVFPHKFLH